VYEEFKVTPFCPFCSAATLWRLISRPPKKILIATCSGWSDAASDKGYAAAPFPQVGSRRQILRVQKQR
jgi:hypothetical protein